MPEAQQNYYALKQISFATKKLFIDDQFQLSTKNNVKWLRPHEICQSPEFFADGVSRFDVQQGALGDCWLVAAMANLTMNGKLFDQVVPPGQSFDPGLYCGLFRFNFWRFGKWIEIVIDDRLPVNESDHAPLYVHSSDPREFWSPLLEKAYAKMYNSYAPLDGGDFCEAMVDFTGGLAERFDLRKPDRLPKNLFQVLRKGFERGAMIGCAIMKRDIRNRTMGLIDHHAYSVTNVLEVEVNEGSSSWDVRRVPLMRLRNPWGNSHEWKGSWSDRSNKWQYISDSERLRIGLDVRDDGEFWMSFDDWLEKFTECEMCSLTPDDFATNNAKHRWHGQHLEGSWQWGLSTGGHLLPGNDQQFATNPQYFVRLTEPDLDDELGQCTLVVSLMKVNQRSVDQGFISLSVGFYVYAVGEGGRYSEREYQHLPSEFFFHNSPIQKEPDFTYSRDVTSRFHLAPGTYVIVPTTLDVGEEGSFLLRVWTEHPAKFKPSRRDHLTQLLQSVKLQDSRTVANGYDNCIAVRSQPPKVHSSRREDTEPGKSAGRPVRAERPVSNDGDQLCCNCGDEIRYPSLPYEGRPRIVDNRVCSAAPSRRALIHVSRGPRNLHPQQQPPPPPPPTKKRGLFRKFLGLKPAKPRQR